jgi:hypothetical protein
LLAIDLKSELYALVQKRNLRAERSLSNVAFKGTMRPNSKTIEEHAMASKTTTNLGLDTAEATALHIEISNRLKLS